MSANPAANAAHIEVWNDILVPKFTRFRSVMVGVCDAHARGPLQRLALHEGAQVLDVGCGFGETTIDLARRVAPRGLAVGIDCCQAFLDAGIEDARRAGVAGARFQLGDAQSQTFPTPFDACFSRFGLMFFQNPVAALRNIRAALRPNGRLLALVWRTIDDNDWLGLPKRIARAHLPPPSDQAASCGPGPFSMADPDTVRQLLVAAQFDAIDLQRQDVAVPVGRTVDDAIEFQLQLGPAGEIIREAGAEGQRALPVIIDQLRDQLATHLTSAGVVLSSSSWSVTARRLD